MQQPSIYNPAPPPNSDLQSPRGGRAKDIIIAVLGIFGLIYIFIPSFIPDFIPDFIPFIGQIDDDMAVLLIANCFRYYGYDIAAMIPGLRWMLQHQKADEKRKIG